MSGQDCSTEYGLEPYKYADFVCLLTLDHYTAHCLKSVVTVSSLLESSSALQRLSQRSFRQSSGHAMAFMKFQHSEMGCFTLPILMKRMYGEYIDGSVSDRNAAGTIADPA